MAEVTIYYNGPIVTREEAKRLGLKRYFTGELCKNGHIAQKFTAQGCCIICSRITDKASRERRKPKRKLRVSHDQLLSLLTYDPGTGDFSWKISCRGQVKIGDIAGSIGTQGYRWIHINGRPYKAHILARFYVTGQWPTRATDHRNQDKTDNSWDNLREATTLQNSANRPANILNTSGYKGVFWHKKNRNWISSITVRGRQMHLGCFADILDAARAYEKAAHKYYGEFAYSDPRLVQSSNQTGVD